MSENTSNNIFFFLTVIGLASLGVYLVIAGHPYFAILVFMMSSSITFTSKEK